jgi:hypothetical protein
VYISTRDAYLAYIKTLGQNDAAYMIVSKLGNISRIAFLTRCSYRNNPLDAPLLMEELEYYNEAAAWTNTLNVKMIQ